MLLPMPVISELYIVLIESNPKPTLITSYIIAHLFSHLENPRLDKVPFHIKLHLFFFQTKYSLYDKLMSPNKQLHCYFLSLKPTVALLQTVLVC